MQNEKNITRRNFLRLCGGAVLMLSTGCGLMEAAVKPAAAVKNVTRSAVRRLTGEMDARYIRQIITSNPAVSRMIMWQSDAAEEGAGVEYRLPGSDTSQTAPASSEAFTDDGVTVYLHAAPIADLEPDTDYEYRIVKDSSGTDWHPFHTPAEAAAFKALIFPDSQSSDYSDWQALAQNAAQRNPDAQFFVNMGDLVDNGEDHLQWTLWMDAVAGIQDRLPFVPIMGNHETYTLDWKVRLPEAYLHEFQVPDNGSSQFQRYYYSFDYGDVHFSVLNTQFDETNDFKPGLFDEQMAWFRRDAAQSKKKWKIVLMHKDILTYGIHNRPERVPGIGDIGRSFMPVFDELGIDLVLTAHLHTYRNRGHLYNFEPADRGPLYILTGVAGNVRYPGLWIDHALDKTIAPQPETDNYLTLEADASHLRIQCFLPDGTKIDDAELTK